MPTIHTQRWFEGRQANRCRKMAACGLEIAQAAGTVCSAVDGAVSREGFREQKAFERGLKIRKRIRN